MVATLGQLIRERRMELNLTQEELAERVGDGVRQSEISRLERNRVTLPRRQRMEQIAVALDIPVGILLSRSGWAGAESIDRSVSGFGGEAADSGDEDEPADARPVSPPVIDQQADTALPESLVQSDPVLDNHAAAVAEHPGLHDAMERAESLVADSEAMMHQAQVTLDQARVSARKRQESRLTRPAG